MDVSYPAISYGYLSTGPGDVFNLAGKCDFTELHCFPYHSCNSTIFPLFVHFSTLSIHGNSQTKLSEQCCDTVTVPQIF